MIQIGDKVRVGSRIGASAWDGVIIAIIPELADRPAMYLVRSIKEITAPTLTPNPNESWVDEGLILARL